MINLDYYVELAVNGDRQGFEELYRQTYHVVYFTCINLLKNEQDALDVTQDVYVTVMNSIYTLQDKGKFLPWLNRVTVNKCKDFLKKNRPILMDMESMENPPMEENENFLPEEYIINQTKRQIVTDIIRNTLSETEYQTILFYYFNGLSVQEIAELMECPQGTVMYRLSAARGKIKKGVLAYENINNDKLYSFAAVPFLASFFAAEFNGMVGYEFFYVATSGAVVGTTQIASEHVGIVAASTAGKVGLGAMKVKIIIGIAAVALVGGGIVAIVMNNNKDNDDKGKNTTEYVNEDITDEMMADIEDDTENIEEEPEDISEEIDETEIEDTEETLDDEIAEDGFSGVEDKDIDGDKATIEVNGEDVEVDMIYGEYDFREGKLTYNGVETTYKECLELLLDDGWEVLYESEIVSIDDIMVESEEKESVYLMKKYADENGELAESSSVLLMFYNSSDETLAARDCDICFATFAFDYGMDVCWLPGNINNLSTEEDIYNAFGVPTYITDDKDSLDERIAYTWDKDDVTLVIIWNKELNAFSSFRYENPTVDYSQYF